MAKYDLSTPESIRESATIANQKAGTEPNQGSYNAGWLHGYAEALKDVSQQIKSPAYMEILVRREYAAIIKALEHTERLHNEDKRSIKKREMYQFMVAEETAISELCKVLGIALRDKNMDLIK